MDYKILYIEDSTPDTFIREFTSQDFSVKHIDPTTLEEVLDSIGGDINALVLDFRLTNGNGNARFDAPTVAQTIRTRKSNMHKDIPIILLSEESLITDYYEDYTSQDLFDFSVPKQVFRNEAEVYSNRIKSFVNAYTRVVEVDYNYNEILGLTKEDYSQLDYRIDIELNNKHLKKDTFAIIRFINHELIQTTGVLVNEAILSARLGVKQSSKDWQNLKEKLNSCAYNGILSDIFPTWWMEKIQNWWKSNSDLKLRRSTAEERVNEIKRITGLVELDVHELSPHTKSKKFWTACVDTNDAIDFIDGLELVKKNLYAWQESDYISINSALEQTKSIEFVNPLELKELRLQTQ